MSDKQTFRDFDSLTNSDLIEGLHDEIGKIIESRRVSNELLDYAYDIIKAAHGGDWDTSGPEWHLGAICFRDRYLAHLVDRMVT